MASQPMGESRGISENPGPEASRIALPSHPVAMTTKVKRAAGWRSMARRDSTENTAQLGADSTISRSPGALKEPASSAAGLPR